ncbi:hypothetical protein BGP77_13495 [Saccharospirillum sp. MSK14-1]|uniref:hypothetical protein n=1 Tax=Saccharospirillum sp. MSK14-1 TaxID=1897632 RepID=UPI000D36AAA9|nr:hypothetical protein [Saccharospirillum sp. MSK14-1]PTY37511.1 hypothetical protein BGP77_13495 [Saccharospirillum sp. MSK14-1]
MSPLKRLLAAIIGLAVMVFLFWIGLFVFMAALAIGIGLAAINAIKLKLTGRPLFASRFRRFYEQQQRRQSSQKGNVIEGEVVNHNDDR